MELKFEPETHLYQSIDEPDKKWTSVTTLIGLFKEKFDTDAVALKCSQRVPTNKKPNKWYGMMPEQIKEAWKNEQHRADSLGTWYHDQREQEVLACETLRRDDIDIPVFHPIIKDGIKMAPDQNLVEGIYPEHFMYLKSAGLCGQADRVEVIGDRVDVYDYKSNKKIEQQSYVNWEGISKKMYPPVQHLDDCNLMHYTLQLSIYMYIILKHNRHLKPGKLVLQHVSFEVGGENEFGYPIHALDLAGDPIVKEVVSYELPYLKDEVESMIKYISKNPNILVDDKTV